ncbi:hypothetical protein L218DRAFT_846762, partial [Marasmius fiardii PR-910]
IMGATGSGKTTFINTASGGNPSTGDGPQSCRKLIQTSPTLTVEGRNVVLLDTPGFDDTTTGSVDALNTISLFFAEMYKSGKQFAGIIYLHRISDAHQELSGMTLRKFRMFQELCGRESLKNVVIVANRGWDVPLEVAEAREQELMSKVGPVLDEGARMIPYNNTTESAYSILRALVEKEPLPLLIQTQVVDDHKTLAETAAGVELN